MNLEKQKFLFLMFVLNEKKVKNNINNCFFD